MVEQGWIKEIDINPLLALSEQLIVLDAWIVLHDTNVPLPTQGRDSSPPCPEFRGWMSRLLVLYLFGVIPQKIIDAAVVYGKASVTQAFL